jgi:formylglycine-generating enzyme required for sulfatase activity
VALIDVPAGTFEQRDARSGTRRAVSVIPFAIGSTPVTTAQFAWGSEASREEVPAHGVTWFEAVAWCNATSVREGFAPSYEIAGRVVRWDVSADGYRLPTEAEWEWAARARTDGPRYGDLEEIAWSRTDGVDAPQPVARKTPNAFGLFDMIGNVWEWCWDYADTARYADYRSLRGGGWADPPWSLAASVRRGSAPDARIDDVGFRVARGPVGAPGSAAGQGWSAAADRERADVRGPRPIGWTPLQPEP